LLLVPLVTLTLLWSNPRHELLRVSPSIVERNAWAYLDFLYGPWFWVHSLYSYALLIAGSLIIARTVVRSPQGTRAQIVIIVLASALPILVNLLYILAPTIIGFYDASPIAITLAAVGMLWGLFQVGLMDVMPIAREMILRNISDGVIVLDTINRIVDINPSAEHMLGCRASAVIGRAPADALDILPALTERVAHAVSLDTEIELELEGQPRLLDLRVSPLHDGEGRYAGRLVLFADVTEQRQAERHTRSSLARLATLIENLHMGVLVESDQGTVQHTNRFFVGLFELAIPPEALLDQPVSALLPRIRALMRDPAQFESHCTAWRAAGKPTPVFQVTMMDDHVLECSGFPILSDALPNGYLWLWRDVTQSHNLAERTQDVLRMETVGRLAGGIAHEFNNLLTVINGYSDWLLNEIAEDDPMHEDLEAIRVAGQRAAELTRQLLAFSRRQLLDMRVLDLNAVITALRSTLDNVVGEQVRLSLRLAPDLAPARADQRQMEQVLVNLASNAHDAMPLGGDLTISTANVTLPPGRHAEQLQLTPGDYVTIAVQDTGIGLSPEVKRHLFEPFFTTKPGGSGTGLALAMSYGVLRQSQGAIEAEGEEGQGALFRIYLPRA
jgi:PAS domain S-box-containing protein